MQKSYFQNNNSEVNVTHILIQEREKEISKIEKETKEVNELFVSLANLVNESAPMLNNIESNIETSVYHSTVGVEELMEAEKAQKICSFPYCCSGRKFLLRFLGFGINIGTCCIVLGLFCFVLFLLFFCLALVSHFLS